MPSLTGEMFVKLTTRYHIVVGRSSTILVTGCSRDRGSNLPLLTHSKLPQGAVICKTCIKNKV